MIATKTMAVAAGLLLAGQAHAGVIEGFESGGFQSKWTVVGANTAVFSAAAAHDGSTGLSSTTTGSDGWWYDTTDQLNSGDVLSGWFQTSSGGRDYLGFGASASGASSFVLGGNTNQLIFQNNDAYAFNDVTTASFTFTANKWYFATVTFGSSIVGNLYDSNGTTLLASLTATGLTHGASGGVALRSFGGGAADTIGINATAAVPEPATWAMMLIGFGGLGYAMRRRPKTRLRVRFA